MEKVIQPKQFSLTLKENIFLYVGFASLAIVSSYDAPLTFDVPFSAIIIFIACILLHCLVNDLRFKSISKISLLLLARLILFIINALVLNIDTSTILEQIVITFISIMMFECMRITVTSVTGAIKNTLLIFSLITGIQLFVGFAGHLFSDKNDIVAGIGYSNYAATFLLMAVAYLIFVDTKWYEKLVIVISIAALLLTQSFGAYIALGVVLIIWLIKKLNWHKLNSWILLLFLIGLGLVFFEYFISTDIGHNLYIKIQDKISYLLSGDFNSFGSSRLELYSFSWNNISRHLLFGSISNINSAVDASYRFQNFRTHNFIFESLLLYGILGTILNLVIVILLVKKVKGKNKNLKTTAFSVTVIAVLLHGFLEPNLFTMHFEPFVWLILGGLMSYIKGNGDKLNLNTNGKRNNY